MLIVCVTFLSFAGADVTKLDQELVFALAQRQIELLTRPMSLKIAADQKSSQAKPAQPLTSPLSVPLQDGKMVMLSRRHLAPNQVPRAVLTPLGGGEAFPMISKSLTVGSGEFLINLYAKKFALYKKSFEYRCS